MESISSHDSRIWAEAIGEAVDATETQPGEGLRYGLDCFLICSAAEQVASAADDAPAA